MVYFAREHLSGYKIPPRLDSCIWTYVFSLQVFFKAEAFAKLEEQRDSKIVSLISEFQALLRGHLCRSRLNICNVSETICSQFVSLGYFSLFWMSNCQCWQFSLIANVACRIIIIVVVCCSFFIALLFILFLYCCISVLSFHYSLYIIHHFVVITLSVTFVNNHH